MWVRLSRMQAAGVGCRLHPELEELLEVERRDAGTFVWIRAPFAAWENVQETLFSLTFTPRGGREQDVPGYFFRALRAITTSLNVYERHPALKGLAMLGHHAETFPVWVTGEQIWSPRPVDGEFVVLRPHFLTEAGRAITKWDGDGIGRRVDWLHDEALHRRFQ